MVDTANYHLLHPAACWTTMAAITTAMATKKMTIREFGTATKEQTPRILAKAATAAGKEHNRTSLPIRHDPSPRRDTTRLAFLDSTTLSHYVVSYYRPSCGFNSARRRGSGGGARDGGVCGMRNFVRRCCRDGVGVGGRRRSSIGADASRC